MAWKIEQKNHKTIVVSNQSVQSVSQIRLWEGKAGYWVERENFAAGEAFPRLERIFLPNEAVDQLAKLHKK